MLSLKDISIFNTLSASDLKEIEPYIVTEKHKKKEMIFSEGGSPDWFYIVLDGKVKITKVSHEGKEIILEVIPPGDFFGGVAVLRGFPYPANAVSMEDSTVLKIARKHLLAILDRFPTAMFCFVQNIGDRMKGSHDALKSVALEKVGSRIAALLLKLSEQAGGQRPLLKDKKAGEGIVIDMRLTKQDIAEMVGTTVETAIRTMSKFKKLGLITERAGKIIIKDPEKLRGATGD